MSTSLLATEQVGDAAEAIATLAWTHGIADVPDPIDDFATSVNRLCGDQEVIFDRYERLLLGLARANVITDDARFALHAAYLAQRGDGVRPVR